MKIRLAYQLLSKAGIVIFHACIRDRIRRINFWEQVYMVNQLKRSNIVRMSFDQRFHIFRAVSALKSRLTNFSANLARVELELTPPLWVSNWLISLQIELLHATHNVYICNTIKDCENAFSFQFLCIVDGYAVGLFLPPCLIQNMKTLLSALLYASLRF
jgi:hypothetical protein